MDPGPGSDIQPLEGSGPTVAVAVAGTSRHRQSEGQIPQTSTGASSSTSVPGSSSCPNMTTNGVTRLDVNNSADADHISTLGSPTQPHPFDEDVDRNKHCWVCFMSEEDEGSNQFGRWVKPCKCRGTAKWVHEECLQRWIDEKQKNNTSAKVSCSQCNTEYLIVFPKMSRFFRWAQSYDNILTSFAPLASAAIFLGSVYWCAISYGALTVVQVVGQEEGKLWLENADPITLMVGLPSIPTFLILGKLIRWEDALIKLWQRDWVSRIPLLRTILRAGDKLSNQGGGVGGEEAGESDSPPRRRSVRNIPVNHRSNYDGARIFCGALLLPTVATFVGRLIYPFVSSDFNRAMLGGLTFILSKGMLNIYLRQQQRSMAEKRQVLDYDPELEAKRNKAAQTDSTTSTPNGPGGAAPGAEDGHAVEPANGQPPVPGPGFHLQIQFGNP